MTWMMMKTIMTALNDESECASASGVAPGGEIGEQPEKVSNLGKIDGGRFAIRASMPLGKQYE